MATMHIKETEKQKTQKDTLFHEIGTPRIQKNKKSKKSKNVPCFNEPEPRTLRKKPQNNKATEYE